MLYTNRHWSITNHLVEHENTFFNSFFATVKALALWWGRLQPIQKTYIQQHIDNLYQVAVE